MQKSAWYLQFEGSEFGPMTEAEIRTVLRSGKLKGKLFAWRHGFSEWAPIENIPELAGLNEIVRLETGGSASDRKHKRIPLMAMVQFTSLPQPPGGGNLSGGICQDISVGGMLIKSNHCPGYAGSLVYVKVMPTRDIGIPVFETNATVAHVLPGDSGFGVEFKNLPEGVRVLLESYITNKGQAKPLK